MSIAEAASKYIKYGISVLPIDNGKKPLRPWKDQQSAIMPADQVLANFAQAGGIGVICGAVSGGLEVVDVDTKQDSTGTLWEDFSQLLQDNLEPGLYSCLVIASTRSGGKHIYYRSENIPGNLKLANQESKEALIETRGEGGYVLAAPSPGYSFEQGRLSNIPTISKEQRDSIHRIAKSFGITPAVAPPEIRQPKAKQETPGLTPWEDYNQRGPVIELLEAHGWTRVGNERSNRINLKRSGNTDSKTSGNFHTDKRTLYIFSSSSEFEPGRGYSPYQVYTLLESGDDFKLSTRRLREAGYGDPQTSYQAPTQVEIKTIQVSSINSKTSESSVISETGKTLKVETAEGDTIEIISPGAESLNEVLTVIAMYEGTGKRIYIKEGDAEGIRSYEYELQALLNRYAHEQDENGNITTRVTDTITDEAVKIGSKFSGIDKERFNLFAAHVLGVSEAVLAQAESKLSKNKAEEKVAAKLNKATGKAQDLIAKGKITEAAKVLETAAKEAKQEAIGEDFSSLFETTTEQALKDEEENQPGSLDSGFIINGAALLLPAGAISVFAAATGHGKTLMLINTVLNVAQANPEKQYVFFTYEERAASIIQYFLNAYADIDLNSSSSTNRRLYREYFRTGSTTHIATDNMKAFNECKEGFFKSFIETGRILVKYIDYDAEDLNGAIQYMSKQPKVGGIFIDYFQLLSQPTGKTRSHNNRQEELKQVCLALKSTAVTTGLPIVLAAQFNREVTNLERLHPTNIGEAGDIERIVNTLVGIWNMYKKPVLSGIKEAELTEIDRKIDIANKNRETYISNEKGMYIEILKSRDLASGGWAILDYNGNTGRIKNGKVISFEARPTTYMQREPPKVKVKSKSPESSEGLPF